MSDVTVTVDDRGLAACLSLLSRDFADLAEDALTAAFVNGGVEMEVWRRTPKSDRTRVAQDVGLDTNIDNPRGDPARITTRKWREKVTPKQAAKVDAAGMTRLALSVLPQGPATPVDVLGFRRTSEGAEMRLASSVPYAGYVHETENPAEGEYWDHSKKGKGWSTPGTGNKYIEDVVDAQRMAEAMADRMNARMRI